MYPKNAAFPERISIGAVVQITDGAVQTSGVTVRIIPSGEVEGDGAGSTAYSTDGVVLYTPTQGETNYASFILIAKKTGCIPAAVTVVPSLSATAGQAVCADSQKVKVASYDTNQDPVTLMNTGVPDVNVKTETNHDFTALQKTSLNAATPASVQNIPVDGSLQVDALKVHGTTQTAKDLGALNVTNLNTLAGHDPGAALVKVADLGTVQTGDIYAALTGANTEPGQGAPAANVSILTKISYLFKGWRNKLTQTATDMSLYNDAGDTVDQKATRSDDAATYTREKIVSGP